MTLDAEQAPPSPDEPPSGEAPPSPLLDEPLLPVEELLLPLDPALLPLLDAALLAVELPLPDAPVMPVEELPGVVELPESKLELPLVKVLDPEAVAEDTLEEPDGDPPSPEPVELDPQATARTKIITVSTVERRLRIRFLLRRSSGVTLKKPSSPPEGVRHAGPPHSVSP
jgi:hypothetical protein